MTPTTDAAALAAHWLEDFPADLPPIIAAAEAAAAGLASAGTYAIAFSPGNGYHYTVALARVPLANGNLLISLPDFNRCLLLHESGSYGTLHYPDYVDEKIDLGAQHAAVLAAFLTLTSAATARP